MTLKVFNICDTPMAFYFQRQSETVNKFYGINAWRYYYDKYITPGCQYFSDLNDLSSKDEVMSVLNDADILLFHATRNYRKTLNCRDGQIRSSEYPKGKMEIVLIHGQPETLEIAKTNEFIELHKKALRFLVATPNQLNLFKDVRLFPIVGQFSAADERYQPRSDFLKMGEKVRIIRRNEWKASEVAACLLKKMGQKGDVCRGGLKQRIFWLMRRLLGVEIPSPIPKRVFRKKMAGCLVSFDNKVYWQELYEVMKDLRAADILLENDWKDYPGGGCNHTIGIEAMSLGVACFNAMTKANSLQLVDWLGADRLPPLPNWDDEAHYRRNHEHYFHRMVFDQDFRLHLKSQSRQFFVDWYDASNVIPRIIKQLGA